MRKVIEKILARQARRLIRKRHPEIIAVTGSVGKSSTKQAVGAVLSAKFSVRVTPGNYNTELGLPLTVLGLESGGKSAWRWLKTLLRGCLVSMFPPKDYPKILVLEMAADKPGDIGYLTGVAAPRVGLVTTVAEAHAESFGSVEGVAKEKQVIVQRLARDGQAILNRDDERVWAMREKTRASVTGFGFHDEAEVRALEISMNYAFEVDGECGMRFKLAAGGSTVPVFIPGVLGRQAIYAALAAAAVGLVKGMNLVEISDGLRQYQPPPGRARCLPGIKRTLLIDDSYNSAPRSAKAALEILRDLPSEEGGHKYAVLGDMLELGRLSEQGHVDVGRKAVECGVDYLVLVGERMADAKSAAAEAGMSSDRIYHFATPEEAGRFVQDRMKMGDVVLVKGSRAMRMDKVVRELMANPLMADSLLVSH